MDGVYNLCSYSVMSMSLFRNIITNHQSNLNDSILPRTQQNRSTRSEFITKPASQRRRRNHKFNAINSIKDQSGVLLLLCRIEENLCTRCEVED